MAKEFYDIKKENGIWIARERVVGGRNLWTYFSNMPVDDFTPFSSYFSGKWVLHSHPERLEELATTIIKQEGNHIDLIRAHLTYDNIHKYKVLPPLCVFTPKNEEELIRGTLALYFTDKEIHNAKWIKQKR